MKVQFNKYNYYNSPVNYSISPSFKGGTGTMQEKLAILLSDTKNLYNKKQNPKIKDFEAIIKKISPTTKVKSFSEIPPNSNISPRTGAYFSQITQINPNTGEIYVKDKIIYLNLNNAQSKLKLFGDFIHESTHIIQEEASDRQPTLDVIKKILYSPSSPEIKNNSIYGGVHGFKIIEYHMQSPLIEAMKKTDDLPRKIAYADKNILNMIYFNSTHVTTQAYIKNITLEVIKQLKTKSLPYANDKYMLQYMLKKAGQEKEAYTETLKFLKDALKIKGDTDLDLRILLYDEFEKTIESMLY